MPSTAASGSGSKRQKGGDSGNSGPPHGAYHPGYGQMPPQQRYQQPPPYGGPPPNGQPPPYGVQPPPPMWQPGQYGGQPPPPPAWQQPPPPNMYPPPQQRGGGPPITPDRGGWNGYGRGPPPPPSSSSSSQPNPSRRNGKQKVKVGGEPSSSGPMEGPPGQPPYQGWSQWPQHQWGGGPAAPPGWQGGGGGPPPPPPHPSQPPMYSNPKMWGGRSESPPPPRGSSSNQQRPRGSPDHSMGGNGMYPPPPDSMCQSVGMDSSPPSAGVEMDMYGTSRGVGPPHDDDGGMGISSSNSRDKGRGSYKCGRCGVPKKGHVCPYQPKLKRRPEDPPPELRNAAVQVEMDEFLTLRRLNLKIQGFPESYATEPYMSDDMVIGEPHPYAVASAVPCEPISQGTMMDGSSPPSGPIAPTMQRGTSPIDLSLAPPRGSPRASPTSVDIHHQHHHPIDQDGTGTI